MEITWKDSNKDYVNGEYGYVGKINIFHLYYDGCRSKDDPRCYRLKCKLPGIKPDLGGYEEKATAILKAEFALENWLERFNSKEEL